MNVPTVEQAELHSDVERVTVRFGREGFSVSQLAPHTAALIQRNVPEAWTCVRDGLEIDRFVTRCGFRIIFLWPTDDCRAALTELMRAGITSLSPGWTEVFGRPSNTTVTALYGDEMTGMRRVSVDLIEYRLEGLFPAGQEEIFPRSAIKLDIDCIYPTEKRKHYSLGPGQLSEFMRSSWESAKKTRADFTALLASKELLEPSIPSESKS